MALTFNVGLTDIDLAEAASAWAGFNEGSGGVPSPQDEADIFIQGTQAVSAKVSGTNQNEGVWYDNTTTIDMTVTGRHLYIWVAVTTVALLNTIANGGIYVKVASDAAGNNWSKFFVGGSDVTPDARFICYVVDLTKTASETAATAATISTLRWFGAGVKSTGTSKSENLIVDATRYGDGQLQVVGDGSTVATWDSFFQEDDLVANKYGIIREEEGVYFLKGRLTIGDATQTATTTFDDDTGAVLVFEDPQFYETTLKTSIDAANLYAIDAEGAASFNTSITMGNVVGSGDDRQGIQGGVIRSAGQTWSLDFATDIADLSDVDLYGVIFTGAQDGLAFDGGTGPKTNLISCIFAGCGEITPGSTSNGAVILNCFVIDPDNRTGTNWGMEFPNTTHNLKNISFITSGTPTTQYMIHLSQSADYTIDFSGIVFFGSFVSATLWHGQNTGTNADVTINSLAGSNPTASEFNNTAGGTVDVDLAVGIEIFGISEGARAIIQQTSDDTELLNALAFVADGQGAFKAAGTFAYVSPTAVRVAAASSGKVVAGISDDTAVFTDETIQANDSRTGAGNTMTLIPAATPATPDAFYFGHTEEFLQMDLDVLTAGAGTYTLAWEYWNGSIWTALPGLVDDTNNYKNAGINRVSWTTPGTWTARTVTSQPGPSTLFYIRARFVSGTVTTTPVGRTTQLDVTKYLRWDSENTITADGLSTKATWIEDTIATF